MNPLELSENSFEQETGINACLHPEDYEQWRKQKLRALVERTVNEMKAATQKIQRLMYDLPPDGNAPTKGPGGS